MDEINDGFMVADHDGHDYFIERVGTKIWVTEDGEYSSLVFTGTVAEGAGVIRLLRARPEMLAAFFEAERAAAV